MGVFYSKKLKTPAHKAGVFLCALLQIYYRGSWVCIFENVIAQVPTVSSMPFAFRQESK
jgi:hypothetical protein